jgi:profilin
VPASEWDTHIDTMLNSGQISQAAIIGLDGQQWASSPHFTVTTDETAAIVEGFTKPASVEGSGVRVAGLKYFFISGDPEHMLCKRAGDGVVIVKTEHALIIAACQAPLQLPEAVPVVEAVVDQLKN